MVAELFERVRGLGIDIELSQEAKELLVERGYDMKFGARPLRRAIQKYIEDPMAESILADDLGEGDLIKISSNGDGESAKLVFDTVKGGGSLPVKNVEEPVVDPEASDTRDGSAPTDESDASEAPEASEAQEEQKTAE